MATDAKDPTSREGWVHLAQAGGICFRCGGPAYLSHFSTGLGAVGYDAHFCVACDVWLESACGSTGGHCSCAERPLQPSEVPYPLKVV